MKKLYLAGWAAAGSAVALLPMSGARASQYHIDGGGLQGITVTTTAFTNGGCSPSFIGGSEDGIDAKIVPVGAVPSITIHWSSPVPDTVGGLTAQFVVNCSLKTLQTAPHQGDWTLAVPGGASYIAVESSTKASIDFDLH
jgi:hypothetical protein